MSQTDIERFRALRKRAYELAETGRYADWTEVKAALRAEKFHIPAKEFRGDRLFQELVTARCRRAGDNVGSVFSLQPSS